MRQIPSSTLRPGPSRRPAPGCWRALLLCLSLPAAALYKVVGPDGRITYTDRPPADGGGRVSTVGGAGGESNVVESNPQDRLPLSLRQTAERYPVTLYTAKRLLALRRGAAAAAAAWRALHREAGCQ